MSPSNNDLIASLAGKELTAVSFVLDYIILEFEEFFLTALSLPYIQASDTKFMNGMVGYRDILCDRIAHKVSSASDTEGQEIRITFDEGSVLAIPLRLEECPGMEAAILQIESEIKWVWRFA